MVKLAFVVMVLADRLPSGSTVTEPSLFTINVPPAAEKRAAANVQTSIIINNSITRIVDSTAVVDVKRAAWVDRYTVGICC